MTLNGVMAVILRYFSEFGHLPGVRRKSSRSLSHVLMSSCLSLTVEALQRQNESKLAASRRGVSLSQDFSAKGSSPCRYIDTTRKAIDCATTLPLTVLANVNSRSRSLYSRSLYAISPVRLSSVVCNVRAPCSDGSNFRQYFYGISYLGHPLTSTENFTEIVPGKPLRRGSQTQEGRQV